MAGWETLLVYDREYKLVFDGLAEEVTAGGHRLVRHPAARGHRVPRRQDPRRRRRRLLHQAPDRPRAGAVRRRRARLGRPERHHQGGRAHRPPQAAAGRLHDPRRARPVRRRHRARTATPARARRCRRARSAPAPYMLESFTPGQESRHVKNPNYWRSGQPFFDEVVVIDFPDDAARVNALLAGQVDAITDVPFAQVQVVEDNDALTLFENEGGGWLPLCMAIDQEPFTDVARAPGLPPDRRPRADGAAGPGRPRARRERPLRRVRPRLPDRPAAARAGHRAGEVPARGGRQGGPRDRPADHQRRHRHGRVRQGLRAAGQGRRREGQRQGARRRHVLRRPVPEVDVLQRLLGHPRLPQPGRRRQPPVVAVQRDALAAQGLQLRGALQAGAGRDRRGGAHAPSSSRCTSSSTTRAATSSRSSTT